MKFYILYINLCVDIYAYFFYGGSFIRDWSIYYIIKVYYNLIEVIKYYKLKIFFSYLIFLI